MPLSWNEIRNRAHEFSKRWENETSEDAEAKPFWTEFFSVFGIDRKRRNFGDDFGQTSDRSSNSVGCIEKPMGLYQRATTAGCQCHRIATWCGLIRGEASEADPIDP